MTQASTNHDRSALARKALICAAVSLSLISPAPSAFAQKAEQVWPARPVRIVVGFPAGGPADAVARVFADHAARTLGQPFIVENKPGVNSSLAAADVAAAPADGHTLLLATTSHLTSAALHGARLKFDAVRSFAPVCSVASTPTVLTVGPSMTARTLAAFLQQVRQQPGRHSYASAGAGSAVHFASEQFMRIADVAMLHVPYKGAAPMVNDLLGAQVDSSFASMGSILPHIKSGKLVALAVAAPKRSAFLPDVPTFEEQGVKGYTTSSWYGLLAPAGTPRLIVASLQRTATQLVQGTHSAAWSKLQQQGIEADLVCDKAFGAQLEASLRTYTQIVRDLDLKPD